MKFRVRIIKKNQILTWGLIAVLVTAGYLNYTNDPNRIYMTEVANNFEPELGDAVFVDSNNLVTNTEDFMADIQDHNFKTTSTEFFSENRINRNKVYAEQLEGYEKILKDNNSNESSLKFAQSEIIRINNEKNAIGVAESLIKAQEIEEVIILVNGESINVIVLEENLTEEKTTKIRDIVSIELVVPTENIHITVL